jgi:hypothetical protein
MFAPEKKDASTPADRFLKLGVPILSVDEIVLVPENGIVSCPQQFTNDLHELSVL